MHDEYKIFLLSEEELTGKEKEEMLQHIVECKECWTKYQEYSGLKVKTKRYYSLIHPAEHKAYRFVNNRTSAAIAALMVIVAIVIVFNINKTGNEQDYSIHQKEQILSSDSTAAEYDIFDTQTWTDKMYAIEKNIKALKKQVEEKPL